MNTEDYYLQEIKFKTEMLVRWTLVEREKQSRLNNEFLIERIYK